MISGIDDALSVQGLAAAKESARTELGQDEFLTLMVTQLRNQDPFKPLDSGEFLGQLAQFGTVAGLNDLNSSFNDLSSSLVSNQALQGAGLVGHNVLAEVGQAPLGADGGLTGAVELPIGSGTVRVAIVGPGGEVVRQLDLGPQRGGLAAFRWNGETDSGEAAAPGLYSVEAQYFDGQAMQGAPVLMQARVSSVSLGANGLTVRLDGIGEVAFNQIREIG